MTPAQAVRKIGEILSSRATLREAWPGCGELLATLAGGRCARLDTDDLSGETAVVERDGTFDIAVPLVFGDRSFGALCIEGAERNDDGLLALLEASAFAIASRLHFERAAQSAERLAELVWTDPLTGIANRRQFDRGFDEAFARARGAGTPLALAIVDIDYFKAFNDTYGHQAGDACLRAVAHALESCARRPHDLVARYGGEEFVVLLSGSLSDAIAVCEQACESVRALGIAHSASSLGCVSISAGAATMNESDDPATLFERADDALYRAKLSGRNRVCAPGYVSDRPPAERIEPHAGNNLPEASSTLIGRSRELRELARWIGQYRIVTITGVGGCGKTRIAIETASRALSYFADGVWFVDLAAVADPALVASAICSMFSRTRDGSIPEMLQAIGAKHTLIVLDNCEHLLDAVARLSVDILATCPRATILATSREPLGIDGESVYPLQPLDVPPAGPIADAAEMLTYDAVGLFVERLRETNKAFVLDETLAPLAATVCRRLDGIPLALQLAAARAAVVGLEQLDRDLRAHVPLADSGDALQRRHATMRALIAWSGALLAPDEARIFRRLAVFQGGFRREAAVDVAWDAQIARAEVPALLERLTRKSLIVTSSIDPHTRANMLETIREYAYEQLIASEELHDVRRRHAHWALSFAHRASEEIGARAGREWLSLLTPDIENFRAAVAWTLVERNDPALGCRLVEALTPFMLEVAPNEGSQWALCALEELRANPNDRMEATLACRLVMMRQLPAPQLRALGERAVELYRALGDREGLARALRVLGQTLGWYFRAERELADTLACEAIELARAGDDDAELVTALRTRGLTIDISDFPAKRKVLEEALALARSNGYDRLIGGTLTWISELEFSAGDTRKAYEYGREALRIAEASGSSELFCLAAENFAFYAATEGHYAAARDSAMSALRLSRMTSQQAMRTYAVQALALVAARTGDEERAARLLGYCNARDGVLHTPRQADQCEDLTHRCLSRELREELGETRFAQLLAEGAELSDQAADLLALQPNVQPEVLQREQRPSNVTR